MNRNNIFFGVILGPYITSRGARWTKCQQMQTSSQWRHMYNKETPIWKPVFVKIMYILVYLWGPEGGGGESSMIGLGLSCFAAIYPITHIYVHAKKGSNLIKHFKVLTQNMKQRGGGSWGPLCRTQVNGNFRTVIPHNRAVICITRET